jgi:capsular exopolysaccharide synthesis family protein
MSPPAVTSAVEDRVVALRPEFMLPPSLVLSSDAGGSAAEAIRALRTDLVAQHFQAGRRALTICGPSAGVGCSFIASNLALALSQIGTRTLLVDANLRSPSLHSIFGATGRVTGLADCLAAGAGEFGSYVQSDVQPNLSIIYAGGVPENPQELLSGRRFNELLAFCLREFEATVLDTPPANICADARRVSSVSGYSLIVARRDLTYVDDVKALATQLAADHARVVGSVLNEV